MCDHRPLRGSPEPLHPRPLGQATQPDALGSAPTLFTQLRITGLAGTRFLQTAEELRLGVRPAGGGPELVADHRCASSSITGGGLLFKGAVKSGTLQLSPCLTAAGVMGACQYPSSDGRVPSPIAAQ